MTQIKICGLRNTGHALVAADAGADFLGFVFVEGVRRQLLLDEAARVIEEYRESQGPGGPKLVGLFADQPVDQVNRVADIVGLDRVQLCGSEGAEHWSAVDRPIFQVLHVGEPPDSTERTRAAAVTILAQRLLRLEAAEGLAILDRQSDLQPGGLGEVFDWSLARTLADQGRRFMLAGGLTPDNVAQAIATARPHGVDVSSGVETDGVKDVAKIRAFVQAAREALGEVAEAASLGVDWRQK